MEGNNSNIDRRLWESGPELLPALETLTLSDIDRVDRRSTSERLALPALRRLMFGEEERLPRAGDDILDYLSLPGLEALPISSDHLLSFLQRSSPPLLELVWGPSVLDSIPLAALRLIPDLRRLEMWWPRYEAVEKLLEALAQSLSLLPHLTTLIIYIARRTQIQVFHLKIHNPGAQVLAPDIILAFRQLVEDGIQVYVGEATERWNIFE
ncbi:hypothetical protein B0H14DRAFT_3450124 [Mycena olivaceomarginata]|nr:hypothetical protein B0H14DRAFT_3450124 [Mycena olivaceomarginata]